MDKKFVSHAAPVSTKPYLNAFAVFEKPVNLKLARRFILAALISLALLWQQPIQSAYAIPQRIKITSGNQYLIVEALNDNLVHFELSALTPGPSPSESIYTSPMVFKTDYPGPTSWTDTTAGNIRTLQTPNTKVEVDITTLCTTVTDKVKSLKLTTYCPLNLSQGWKGLTMTPESFTHGYGLGSEFITSGSADGDWIATANHRVRTPGPFGNEMKSFDSPGMTANTQYPVLYLLGSGNNNYAMFLDNYYKQEWRFDTNPWKVEMWGDWIRWYVMTSDNLPILRQSYMELVGRPPVPPKKMFGLWLSTYGYRDWGQVDNKLAGLKNAKFPVDGFVLDLYWFGGITKNSDNTKIGKLTWDTSKFPNPAAKLTNYKDNDGVGIILIEESLVGKGLPEWTTLKNSGYLVREGSSTADPVYICHNCPGQGSDNDYFGNVGIIDWTNTEGADWWHDNKRQALIDAGVVGHWLDLNEPEGGLYHTTDWYTGFDPHIGLNPDGLHSEADIHNMFAFFQAQSVARGFVRNNVSQRPFMMSRSGAPGIQRFGATQWSADINSSFASLATWSNAQMMMTLSGMDYYSSDLGGFKRECYGGCDMNDLYTQWFATGMMFDVPGRPHADDDNETSPAALGKVEGNRANAQRRYELSPYIYSLAYRAWLVGEPVVPPLVYYYQSDPNVRTMGHEKLLGRDLLAGIVAGQGEFKRDMYLPAGDWVYFDSNEWFHSSGQTFAGIPEYRGYNLFRLPLFARAGALIPSMYVDDQTGNALGFRRDGSTHNELIVRTYASSTPTSFTLYEDDGQSTDYTTGTYRTTLLSQQKTSPTSETVTIAASSGTYAGAPASRNNVITLVVENQRATGVTLNGSPLTQFASKAAFDAASSGWYNAGYNLIQAKSGDKSVTTAKTFVFTLTSAPAQASVNFVCTNGYTTPGQSVFVVGNIPALGNWDPTRAIKLEPNNYPIWQGVIQNLPVNTTIEWKCIKRNNNDNGNLVWEPDGSPNRNNIIPTPGSGFGGSTTDGGF